MSAEILNFQGAKPISGMGSLSKLYNIALSKCDNVQFIETYKELDFSNITVNDFIVIASGASTPDNSIQEVVNCLHSYCRDMTSNLQ